MPGGKLEIMDSDVELRKLVEAIAAGDDASASSLLAASPSLATARFAVGASRQAAGRYFIDAIRTYIYAGDTALHIAAAAYRTKAVKQLLELGADVRAKNRRGAEPLHSAAGGGPGTETWNPREQCATIVRLIQAGADPNATDKGGVTPLHRAVRTRCADAVKTLLDHGANPALANGNGSLPILLAKLNTGRGGTGSPKAKAQQKAILQLLK